MNGVVVGVDGSVGSAAALRFAVDEARMRGSTVHAIGAWALPAMAYAGGAGVDDLPVALQTAAREGIAKAIEQVDIGDVPVEQHVIEGHAARVLLEAGSGADLLVVGSRGLGGFSRLLLGSVGQQVVHHPPCPVVIVPLPPE